MKLVPQDTYIRCVLGIKAQTKKLVEGGCHPHRAIAVAIMQDVDVLVDNLKENGLIDSV